MLMYTNNEFDQFIHEAMRGDKSLKELVNMLKMILTLLRY